MRYYKAASVVAFAAAALSVAACSPSSSSSSDGKTHLSVWSWRTEDKAAYDQIFGEFTKAHPDITVEFKPYKNTEYNTILNTGLAGDQGPDVAMLRSYGQLQPVVEAGSLVALDGQVDVNGFSPAVLSSARGRKDGKLYGVPAAVQTLQVYYNKDLFTQNGVQPPTTWAQLLQAAQTLKGKGVTPFATTAKDIWMLPIVMDTFGATRYGGAQFEKDLLAGRTKVTDPDYVAALQLVKDLQPYFPNNVADVSYTDAQTLFFSGKAAMFPGGSFELGFFTKQNPDLKLGAFQVPPPPGAVLKQPVTPGYADASFGINAKSAHQKEALELVKWIATKEFGQRFTDQLKQISPVPGVTPTDPLLAELTANYASNPAPYLMLVDFRYGTPTGTDLVSAGLQKMLLGQQTAQQVAADVDKGLAQWFKPAS